MQNLGREKTSQFLNYDKLNDIRLLGLPKAEKKDVPDYIDCPKYKKAMGKLDAKMEKFNSKVSRLQSDLYASKSSINSMKSELDTWRRKATPGLFFDNTNANDVAKQNHACDMVDKYISRIEREVEKHDEIIDKLKEAEEEAAEALQELTLEALSVVDEDIAMVLSRCEGVADNLANGGVVEELIASVEICLIVLRVYAMFDDLIEDKSARSDCRDSIAKVNQILSTLCANASVQSHVVDIYQRNLDLVTTNAGIHQQVVAVLGGVDQNQLDNLAKTVNAPLSQNFNTKFDYDSIIDPAEIDAIVVKMNQTIESLSQNIERASAAEKSAVEYAVTGVNADKQAKTLRATMQSNVDALNGPLTQSHFAVQMIDESVIDDFYQKDIRTAVTAFRKHIISAIGEDNFDSVINGGEDRFSLSKAQDAIDKANLTRLQSAVDKVPGHIREWKGFITGLESDIQKANEVPKKNADALKAEMGGRYARACFPVFGWISAIGINGKINAFKSAFCSTNQIYKDLGNDLLTKNKKMLVAVLIWCAIFCFGGAAALFVLNPGNMAVNIGLPGAVLFLYLIDVLVLSSVGKKLRAFCKIE
jgi:hypothetical protein